MRVSAPRWFAYVAGWAAPLAVAAAVWSVTAVTQWPSVIVGCAVLGLGYGRPGSSERVDGKTIRRQEVWDWALIALGAIYAGVFAGINYYQTH